MYVCSYQVFDIVTYIDIWRHTPRMHWFNLIYSKFKNNTINRQNKELENPILS